MVATDLFPDRHPIETVNSFKLLGIVAPELFRFLPFQNPVVQLSFQYQNIIHRCQKYTYYKKKTIYEENFSV